MRQYCVFLVFVLGCLCVCLRVSLPWLARWLALLFPFLCGDVFFLISLRCFNIFVSVLDADVRSESANIGGQGGAIALLLLCTLDVSQCTFENNSASVGGGGLTVSSSTATVSESIFRGNEVMRRDNQFICGGKEHIVILWCGMVWYMHEGVLGR